MSEKTIVYRDGTSKVVPADSAWEYENDPDWLRTERALLSEPQDVEGGAPELLEADRQARIRRGDYSEDKVAAARLLVKRAREYVAAECADPRKCQRTEHEPARLVTELADALNAEAVGEPQDGEGGKHSVFEPRDMKATIERGEWTPPTSPPASPTEGEKK